MKSSMPGGDSSGVELGDVTLYHFVLHVDGRRLRVSYYDFPCFREATTAELAAVRRPSPDRLRWPLLDVDLSLDSIEHPGRYPLVSGCPDRESGFG